MSAYTRGDERNCQNCGRCIYFGGLYWWHKRSDSDFCAKEDPANNRKAVPETDDIEKVREAAPELLEVLKLLRADHSVMRPHHEDICPICKQADAAIAKAEGCA